MARRQIRKRKEKKNIEFGVAHIQSTFNNTIITITDKAGNAGDKPARRSGGKAVAQLCVCVHGASCRLQGAGAARAAPDIS